MYRDVERRSKRLTKALYPLVCHFLVCLLLSILMVKTLDGYLALAKKDQARRQPDGHYVFRVSDITTLISTGLVLVKLFSSAWIGIALWSCAFTLFETDGLDLVNFSRMMSFGVPPLRWSGAGGAVAVVLLLCILPQHFIAPLLSGSVNWNSGIAMGKPMSTMSNTEKAQSYMWYYYLSEQGSRKYYITNTVGFADKAWVNLNLEMANKRVGATCRHVVPNHNFPVDSLLLGATIPCIDIHDISWATEPAPQSIIDLVQDSSPLSVVGEKFLNNFQEGQAALFDPQPLAWDSDKLIRPKTATADYPAASLFSGKKTVLLYRGRGASSGECNVFATGVPSLFGNAKPGDTVFQPSGSNRCYMYGTVSFTAGVIKPPKSRYISSQVVGANVIAKGTHPLREEDTVASFEQSIWVSEALSLMSDVMTVIAITNSSSLPTWNNLDNYTGALIRIAYLAAWDMLHGSFEQTDTTTLQALPAAQRLRASVSPERVFGWFAVNLLLTASGIVIIWVRSKRCERGIILDAPAAALLTDAGGVVDMYPDMTRLSIVADEDKKVGNIYLNSVADQDGRPKFRLELHKGVL